VFRVCASFCIITDRLGEISTNFANYSLAPHLPHPNHSKLDQSSYKTGVQRLETLCGLNCLLSPRHGYPLFMRRLTKFFQRSTRYNYLPVIVHTCLPQINHSWQRSWICSGKIGYICIFGILIHREPIQPYYHSKYIRGSDRIECNQDIFQDQYTSAATSVYHDSQRPTALLSFHINSGSGRIDSGYRSG
jgi:hypothetical protein